MHHRQKTLRTTAGGCACRLHRYGQGLAAGLGECLMQLLQLGLHFVTPKHHRAQRQRGEAGAHSTHSVGRQKTLAQHPGHTCRDGKRQEQQRAWMVHGDRRWRKRGCGDGLGLCQGSHQKQHTGK